MTRARPEPGEAPGPLREQLWNSLLRARVLSYPLPPHGHHPNFRGAAQAARRLLAHPRLSGTGTLVVGPERALYPLRRLALAAGLTLYVPDQRGTGGYWRLSDPLAARLKAMPALGELHTQSGGARAAVLACVGVSRRGERLSKGFGWGAAGLDLPTYTLAHPLMLLEALPCPADSWVELIATPEAVLEVTPT